MERLRKQLSSSLLPVTQLTKLLDVQLPKEKETTKQLPWLEFVKHLINRAADTASEILFENVFIIIKINLEKTVQRGFQQPKKHGREYCSLLGGLFTHVHNAFEDKDLPAAEVRKLTSLLLTGVIDMEAISVRMGEETEAISRIFIKLTLVLGQYPELILDTLLHCRTLVISRIRRPQIFAPVIKRLFTTVKSKRVLSPHLYLKYLLLGKLWLFMTEKEEVLQRRTYIINSLMLPPMFVDWAIQSEIPWLKLNEWNTRLILKSMTVTSALQTLYGDDQPVRSLKTDSQRSKKKKKTIKIDKVTHEKATQDVPGEVQKRKNKKMKNDKIKMVTNERTTHNVPREVLKGKNKKKRKINKLPYEKTSQDASGETLCDINKGNALGRIHDGLGNTHLEDEENNPQNIRIKKDDEACTLARKMGKHASKFVTVRVTKKRNKIKMKASHTDCQEMQNELVRTKREKNLLDAPRSIVKKMKMHESKERDERQMKEEEKEVMMVREGVKNLKRENLETEPFRPLKKKKKSGDTNKLEVVTRGKKGKKLKIKKSSTSIKNTAGGNTDTQNPRNSDRAEIGLSNPLMSENSSVPVALMGRKHIKAEGHAHATTRIRTQSDSICQGKYVNIKPRTRRVSDKMVQRKKRLLGNRVGRQSSKTGHKFIIAEHDLSSLHQKIRKDSITFTVTDLKPVTPKPLFNIKYEGNRSSGKFSSGVKKVAGACEVESELVCQGKMGGDWDEDSEAESKSNKSDEEFGWKSDHSSEEAEENNSGEDSDKVSDLHLEVKLPTGKKFKMLRAAKIVETRTMSPVLLTECVEDSTSDVDILDVVEVNSEPSKIQQSVASEDDTDEASGTDNDVVPCDEKKVFTDEETKNYHKKLLEAAVQRKVEEILKEDEGELKRKRKEDKKMKGTNVTIGSDVEILDVVEVNSEPIKIQQSVASEDDTDEASGTDNDVVPCEEETKMFTDEETKNYHKKLAEAAVQRKVEEILKEDERELKRKRTEDEKMERTNVIEESSADSENSDKEMVGKKPCDSGDLVNDMIKKLYKPYTKVKEGKEQTGIDLESNDNLEVILQTIVKDTGRLTSIRGLHERLLSNTCLGKEPSEGDSQTDSQRTEVDDSSSRRDSQTDLQRTEVDESSSRHTENSRVIENKEIVLPNDVQSLNIEKSKEYIDQEVEEIEVISENKNTEVTHNQDNELLENFVNYTRKSQENEGDRAREQKNINDSNGIADILPMKNREKEEINKEIEHDVNLEFENNVSNKKFTTCASTERSVNQDSLSCHISVEAGTTVLPVTSRTLKEKNDNSGKVTLKPVTDHRFESQPEVKPCEENSLEEMSELEQEMMSSIKVNKIDQESDSCKNNSKLEESVSFENRCNGETESVESEGENSKLVVCGQFSPCYKNKICESSVLNFPKSTNGLSVEVNSIVAESLSESKGSEDSNITKIEETIPSITQEVEDLSCISKNVFSTIKSIVRPDDSEGRTINTEMESITEESEKSVEGADEAYEASSDASEDPAPKIRRRTRSLRRSLAPHTFLQEASDSDASPVRRTRRRRSSEATGNAHLGLITKRSESCLETSVSGSSVSVQSSQTCLSESALDEREKRKACSDDNERMTNGPFHIYSTSDSSANGPPLLNSGSKLNTSNVNELHNISCSSITPSGSSIRRRSSRLMEKTADLHQKQSDLEGVQLNVLSGAAPSDGSVKSMKTEVVIGKSMKKVVSGSETVPGHMTQQKFKRDQANDNEHGTGYHEIEHKSFVADRGTCNFDHLSFGVDENSQELISEKSESYSDNLIEGDTINGLSSTNENKMNLSNMCREKTNDVLNSVTVDDGKDSSVSNINDEDLVVENRIRQVNISEQFDERDNRILDEILVQEHERDVEYLDEDEGEELEVLSTSGTEENDEGLSHHVPATLCMSDSEQVKRILNEKIDMPASQKTLRSFSRRTSYKHRKKENGLDSIRRDDNNPFIPQLKVHCVSEAVLTKEVLISPEVSDEECELVSPGVASDAHIIKTFSLPDALANSPKRSPSPISKSSCGQKKNSGGIRSPEKMIPEEQDETTLPKGKSKNVMTTPHIPKVKSLAAVNLQDKVRSKATCTMRASDKSTLTRKSSKTVVGESLKSPKNPSRNKTCSILLETSSEDSPRKRTSSKSNSPIEEDTQERSVIREILNTHEDSEISDKTDDRAPACSVQRNKDGGMKEATDISPVIVNKQNSNIGYLEEVPIISANESTDISSCEKKLESKVTRKTRFFRKDSEINVASEMRITNETPTVESDGDSEVLDNGVQQQNMRKEATESLPTLESAPKQETCSCLSESSPVQNPSLRRSSRLMAGAGMPSPGIHDVERIGSINIVPQDKRTVEILETTEVVRLDMANKTAPGLARMDELTFGLGNPDVTRKLYLENMKASPRTFEASSSLPCQTELPDGSSSKKDEFSVNTRRKHGASPVRSSPRSRRSVVKSLKKNHESPTGLAHIKVESPRILSFVGDSSSYQKRSPSTKRDEALLGTPLRTKDSLDNSLPGKNQSPLNIYPKQMSTPDSFLKKGELSTSSFSSSKTPPGSLSSRSPRTPVRSSSRKNASQASSSSSKNESPSSSSSHKNESPASSSSDNNESPARSSSGKNKSPARALSDKNKSPSRPSLGKTESTARSSPSKSEQAAKSSSSKKESPRSSSLREERQPASMEPVVKGIEVGTRSLRRRLVTYSVP